MLLDLGRASWNYARMHLCVRAWCPPPPPQVHANDAIEKPPSISYFYKKELGDYTSQLRLAAQVAARQMEQEALKHEAVALFSEKLRTAILSGEKVTDFWRPAATAATVREELRASLARPLPVRGAPGLSEEQRLEAERMQAEAVSFVERAVVEAEAALKQQAAPDEAALRAQAGGGSAGRGKEGGGTASASAAEGPCAGAEPASASGPSTTAGPGGATTATQEKRAGSARAGSAHGAGPSNSGSSKPAWAISSEQAAAIEEEEEEELLRFTQDLDFDAFVDTLDDVELQSTFKVWMSRVIYEYSNIYIYRSQDSRVY